MDRRDKILTFTASGKTIIEMQKERDGSE